MSTPSGNPAGSTPASANIIHCDTLNEVTNPKEGQTREYYEVRGPPPMTLPADRNMPGPLGDDNYFYHIRWDNIDRKEAVMFFADRSNGKRLTRPGDCVRRWHHWNQRGPHANSTVGRLDSPWVRCREEVSYQLRLWDFLATHVGTRLLWDILDHVVLDWPLEQHWAITSRAHFFFGLNIDTKLRLDPSMGKVLGLWHNLDAFSVTRGFVIIPISRCPAGFIFIRTLFRF